jgi:hypothetical protein
MIVVHKYKFQCATFVIYRHEAIWMRCVGKIEKPSEAYYKYGELGIKDFDKHIAKVRCAIK